MYGSWSYRHGVMSSRSDTPSQTTGAHRRHRAPVQRGRTAPGTTGSPARRRPRPQGTLPAQPPAHYEPYLDGLFTYCLSVLCEHDSAAAALGDVLAVAERQRARLRDPELRRPWLYALARWACLRTLAEGRPVSVQASADVAARRRGELAALAWPEAAGTTPEQREALELAVRHQLAPHEVALVVGREPDATRALLAQAACEVERTRAALAVVELGNCAAVARLAGDARVLLGSALRRELVTHVDVCAHCRVTAERAVATGPWPGLATTAATAVLSTVEAPRSAAYAALLHAMRGGVGRARQGTPRFDRHGFPMDLKERMARRARMRHRAVTSTVVAAVVAAPVLALWAAYHGAPLAPSTRGRFLQRRRGPRRRAVREGRCRGRGRRARAFHARGPGPSVGLRRVRRPLGVRRRLRLGRCPGLRLAAGRRHGRRRPLGAPPGPAARRGPLARSRHRRHPHRRGRGAGPLAGGHLRAVAAAEPEPRQAAARGEHDADGLRGPLAGARGAVDGTDLVRPVGRGRHDRGKGRPSPSPDPSPTPSAPDPSPSDPPSQTPSASPSSAQRDDQGDD